MKDTPISIDRNVNNSILRNILTLIYCDIKKLIFPYPFIHFKLDPIVSRIQEIDS